MDQLSPQSAAQNAFANRKGLSMSLDGEGTSDVSGPKLMLQAATPDASSLPTGSAFPPAKPPYYTTSLGHVCETASSESEACSSESETTEVFGSGGVGYSLSRTSGDGGSEHESGEFISPEQRTARILAAVEFYFSDEHVAKDAFMYRHIMRGKGGFVNMKLVASFRKVKNITKDWTIVRDAVKSSTILQLNEESTKVKRIVPFSPTINPLAKCILVYNLGPKPSMGVVEQHLEKYGRICKISIYFPGQAAPNEVRAQRARLEIAATEPLAVVEFATSEEARKVIAEVQQSAMLSASPGDGASIQVALLNMKGGSSAGHRLDSCSDNGSENERSADVVSFSDPAPDADVNSDCSCSPKPKLTQGSPSSSRRRKKKTRLQHLAREDNSCTSDTGSEGSHSIARPNRSWSSDGGANSPSWRAGDGFSSFAKPKSAEGHSAAGLSPKQAMNGSSNRRHWSHASNSSVGSPKTQTVDGIIRHPHGPSENGFAIRHYIELLSIR